MTRIVPEPWKFDLCLLTDAGCRRTRNEDCIRWIEPGDDRLRKCKGVLAIVADGMGGHQAGQVASQLAVDVITHSYYRSQYNNPLKALQQAFSDANQAIYQTSLREPSLRGMGTTGTTLVLKNGRAYLAHVGDSRLYRLRHGKLSLLTEDHTLVMEMLKRGLISFEDARHHPDRNIITHALGTRPEVTISTSQERCPVQTGEYFILCSDGLHDLVSDDEIRRLVLGGSPRRACRRLIKLARQRGGYDNISVGILAIRSPAGAIQKVPATRPLEVQYYDKTDRRQL